MFSVEDIGLHRRIAGDAGWIARKDKKQRESPELELLWVQLDTQPWSWSWHNFVFLAEIWIFEKRLPCISDCTDVGQ